MPEWSHSHGAMVDFIGGDALVGHNVSFEKSVITRANEVYGLPAPPLIFTAHCFWRANT
ncbi:hypothetical protein ACFUCV_03070 [Specibacter sp. NPDC057265]|uniref:hypothetical protein n=1 Tax=Specibacter sp. NPDC057265 TaxID=3346075 RepID=UPI003643129D